MSLRGRILRLLTEEYGGDRKRTVLAGVAGGEEKLAPVLKKLMDEGRVVVRRDPGAERGGQRYGLAR